MSRIYGGIHFQFDNDEGKRTGGLVGDYVVANFLLPNAALPLIRIEGWVDGALRLRVHGRIGQPFALEASRDFQKWESLADGVAAPGGIAVSDAAAVGRPARFYRVRQ